MLRHPLTLEQARETVRRQLADRGEAWLRSLEHNVYGNPNSPYLPLLNRAQCELGDLRATVTTEGLEPTLNRLRDAGVYVSFEEFKGRQPIDRGDLVPHYSITEAGHVAIPCASPSADTDMHVLTNLFAVTQHTRQLSGVGITVDPLSLTSLGSLPVKVLLNVETDDYGELSERNCGCPIDEAELHVHLSNVYSFGKLTGEGVSLVGTHVQHILDDLLPRRFGGTGLDYQLVEEEDDRGYTAVVLVASPRVPAEDAELVEAFLEGLGSGGLAADVRSIWRQAGTMQVRRAEPIATSAGKVLPLVTTRLKPAERRGGA